MKNKESTLTSIEQVDKANDERYTYDQRIRPWENDHGRPTSGFFVDVEAVAFDSRIWKQDWVIETRNRGSIRTYKGRLRGLETPIQDPIPERALGFYSSLVTDELYCRVAV